MVEGPKIVVVPAVLEARPSMDKGRGIRHTEIKPGNPDIGLIDTAGIDTPIAQWLKFE